MWVKAYIKHKTDDLVKCDLLFKHGKIQEMETKFFKGITPFENNSELADDIVILKTYKQDKSNKFCKYFIKKSIDKEVHLTYLKMNYFQYAKLQWQLKKYLIQSNDLKLEILKYLVVSLISVIGTFFYLKREYPIQKPNNAAKTVNIPSKILNTSFQKKDTLKEK